jgi:hypothetical protein
MIGIARGMGSIFETVCHLLAGRVPSHCGRLLVKRDGVMGGVFARLEVWMKGNVIPIKNVRELFWISLDILAAVRNHYISCAVK